MPPSYSIRPARPSDAEVLCGLIRRLAEYEKLGHEARPVPERLAAQLDHGASPPCGAFLAVSSDGSTVGFALFFLKYSTFLTDWGVHLEDLFVLPDHRKRGVGLGLMRAVARYAVSAGCQRLELSVLDWNRDAIDFYERLGGHPLDDWTTFRFSGIALQQLGEAPATS